MDLGLAEVDGALNARTCGLLGQGSHLAACHMAVCCGEARGLGLVELFIPIVFHPLGGGVWMDGGD